MIEALRARGFDPTKLSRIEAFDCEGYSEPHRLTVEDRNVVETGKLADLFAGSVLDQANSILSSSSKCAGSPGEIRTPVDGSLPGLESKAHHWPGHSRPLLVHYTTGLQETRVSGQDPISLLRQSNNQLHSVPEQ